MMDRAGWQGLVLLSLRTPKVAAAQLLELKVSKEALWLALVLLGILNAIVFSVSIWINPPAEVSVLVPRIYQSPTLFATFLTGGLILTVFTLYWCGRMLGGRGALRDVLVVFVWLQVLRLLFQLTVSIATLVLPFLAGGIVLGGNLIGIWILISFVNAAHRFDNMGTAFGVILVAIMGAVFGLAFLMSLLGGLANLGVSG